MGIVGSAFTLNGVEHRMRLELDGKRDNERAVWAALQRGKFYEADEANVMLRVLRPGDTVFDVGANIGYFSILTALLVGTAGRVVAFEPGAENVARLRANIALNALDTISIVEKAATNREGEITFYINSDNSGGNALWDPGQYPTNDASRANPRPVTVPATTLDAEMKRLGGAAPKLVKIDTEGAEQCVIEGGAALLRPDRVPFVLTELHEFGLQRMHHSQLSLRQAMAARGYSTFVVAYRDSLPKLVPNATRIRGTHIINILFSTPELVGPYWPEVVVDPSAAP